MYQVTLSAFRSNLTLDKNYSRHNTLLNGLRNLGLKPQTVVGFYQEDVNSEPSYELSCEVVMIDSWDKLQAIYTMACDYEQDSILLGDDSGYYLIMVDGHSSLEWRNTVTLGKDMIEVTEQEMITNGAGTVRGNRYYIIK